jgi:Zn-dependent protease
MRWTWRIGRLCGIDIDIHATFWILVVGWMLMSLVGSDLPHALTSTLFLLSVFGVVVLHELGHALTARRFGIRTRSITLLPIGGVAQLDSIPRVPWQEVLIALAGPAVNGVIAAACFAAVSGLRLPLVHFMEVNVALALFNLLPIFPMDGGRVLRALLSVRLGFVRATETAAAVAQRAAIVLGIFGVLNPMLLLIAVFVYQAAEAEASCVRLNEALDEVSVLEAMRPVTLTLEADDSIETGLEALVRGFGPALAVTDHGRLSGLLTEDELLLAAREGRARQPLGTLLRDAEPTVSDEARVLDVLEQMQRRPFLPVVRDGCLLGIVSPQSVDELIRVKEARRVGLGRHPVFA